MAQRRAADVSKTADGAAAEVGALQARLQQGQKDASALQVLPVVLARGVTW
jgi:hypothetical protein